jgi:hypothetical protein
MFNSYFTSNLAKASSPLWELASVAQVSMVPQAAD